MKSSIRQLLLRIFLCLLVLASLAVRLNTAVWPLAAVVVWLLFRALFRLEKPLRSVRLWVLAALFSAVMTLGASFASVGTAELVTGQKALSLVIFLGRLPLYYAAMRLLLHALRSSRVQAKGNGAWRATRWGGLLLLCWLPWYACLFPGTVSNDSITQLKEIMGVIPLSNGNPVFQTAILALFRWMGLLVHSADAGVALYVIVQAVMMAWLLGAVLEEIGRSAAPRWLLWASAAFYAFCPIFPVFAFCVGKDTNFAMAVLFFSLMLWRVVHTPRGERVPAGRIACLCLSAVLCTLLRNVGVFLAGLALVLMLLWTLADKRLRLWHAPALGFGCVLAVYATLHLAVIPALEIAPTPETENYSVPLQQVARIVLSDGLTPEQAEIVERVLPLEKIKEAYNGELSDAVKALWRTDASDEDKRAFWRTWPEIVLSNPATALSATFHNTYGYLYPGYMSAIKPTLIIGDQSTRTASVKGLYDYSVNPLSTRLKALTDRLSQSSLYRVLIAPGLYGWITLFSAACLLKKRRGRDLLCAVPALFTLAGCLLSAVNGYFRYAMPLYLCAPFLLWLTATAELADESGD